MVQRYDIERSVADIGCGEKGFCREKMIGALDRCDGVMRKN